MLFEKTRKDLSKMIRKTSSTFIPVSGVSLRPAVVLSALLISPFTISADQAADQIQPEMGFGNNQIVRQQTATDFMVATANPLATQAGYNVLAAGGNAIDAMVAVQTVLGLVEPQSSGLGGGAFAVYYDAKQQKLTSFDARETAPLAATPSLFMDNGEPLSFYDAVVGGRSVGTPGTVKLLDTLHATYGSQDWASLLQPAQQLAKQGFSVSPRLASSIEADQERLSRYSGTRDYFFTPDGSPLSAGALLKNPEYAHTLGLIAQQRSEGFYKGETAQAIVDTVRTAEGNSGVLSLKDLEQYKIIEREPMCAEYLQYDVCGMGPPSSGALTVGQILKLTEPHPLKVLGDHHPMSWQIIGDASRLAFADRGRYMADTDFVDMPEGLLDEAYLRERSKLITPGKALHEVQAGNPPWKNRQARADDQAIELPSTSHFVIVDADGNVLSMTTTIENGFGSRLMVAGFLLNNELTDFSFVPEEDGAMVANRVEPGKRPRSSMSPTIVMKDNKPYLAIGSPGGSRIIGYVAGSLIRHLLWEQPIAQAINAPHLINRFGTFDLETGEPLGMMASELERMGFEINHRDLNSGLQAIKIEPNRLTGAADKRREGSVMGM
jgi:gamma-glutamyltranspeptidase/glutathione hydrolase